MRRGNQAEKDPILLADEALFLREFEILAAERIVAQAGAIGLIGGEALDRIEGISGGGRTFVRREIADQVRAAAGNGLSPDAGIMVESLAAMRLDLIADEAGDYLGLLIILLR